MRSGYVSWFLRAMRVLPVIAGAALIGGIIGGFAMFAIDSAFTWEPVSQRPEARADNQANAAEQRATRPVRVVGGAIPDPSAGMSAPPPQPQRSSAPAQPQISSQLLAPKPLGPASQLQPQNQTANLKARVQTQNAAATPQQPTRWPDALSRAHQNAAMPGNTTNANVTNATNAPQQTTALPASAAVPSGERAVSADDQDRADTSRHGRHSRRHGWRYSWRHGGDDDAAASSARRQDARTYDRLYDSYSNRRSRHRDMSHVITPEQPEESDRTQGTEAGFRAAQPRSEPFWGGGSFRRGDGYESDDD